MKICKIHGQLQKKDTYVRPNGVKNCYFCRQEHFRKYSLLNKKRIAANKLRWENENRNHVNNKSKLWIRKNKEKHNKKISELGKRNCRTLTDSYVRKNLTLQSNLLCADIPEILIILKRVSLLIKRYLKCYHHKQMRIKT